MKKVMKTFTFGSKGFMRILLLCMIACFSLTQARADYYYKVKLADMNGNPYSINGKEWSDWIFVSKGSGLANALNKLIGGKFSEQEKDASGNLKFKYNDNNVEKEISLSEAVVEKLTKNEKGNYMYDIDGTKHELIPVTKDVYRLGRTIKDESGQDITLGYTNEGQIMSTDENYYTKYTHTYKIVGMAIGRGTDNGGDILDYSDHAAFGRMKHDLIELDLAAWSKETFTGSYYMSNMSNLETLILPDHNFAIGDSYTFAGANNLTAIRYGHYDAYYKTLTITDNCNVTCIGKGAFKHGYKIPQATIQTMINKAAAYAKANPNANKDGFKYNKIGDEAFYQCYQITELEIPDGIAEIGSDAFSMTKAKCSFNKLTFAGSNIKIGDKAFQGCEMLKDIVLGENVKITNLGEAVFADSRCISNESVASILNNYAANSAETKNITDRGDVKYIPAYLFFGVQGKGDHNTCQLNFDELNIPDAFGAIGEGAFGHTEDYIQQFKEIIVNAAVAPVCGKPEGVYRGKDSNGNYIDDDVFSNVGANHVTITFNGAAAGYSTDGSTGYKTYRKEAEFMRLLTKTLKEDNETYDVYPQMHANVVLTRKFKEGWNTLALPFGSPSYPNARDMDCAEVYTTALGATDIAVYRGLRVNSQDASKSVFTFLHYGKVTDDPLDEFEPILVKMPATVTKQEYTFKNVDLNYDRDYNNGSGKLYTAAEIVDRGFKNSAGGHFDGQYNDNDPVNFPLFNGNNYTTFYFDGTFKMIKDESNSIFKEGDYIIQDGKFIMCKTGKKYGMKGFRGYFKQFNSSRLAQSEAINIAVYDGDGTVTDIVRVDANGEAEANAPHDIYNIMGQKVRSNALSTEGLKSGIYIINGKKVLVK